jgi:parallel beta-helix repeat protein
VIRGYDFAFFGGDRVEIVDTHFRSEGDGGVSVGVASRISRSYVSGGHYYGIQAGAGSLLDSLVVEAGNGIALGNGGRLTHSVVSTSTGTADAVSVGSNTTVMDNTCKADGSASTSAIRVSGTGNRIEGNVVAESGIGLKVTGSGNLIVRNNAHNNVTANFDIAPGNDVGPVGTAATSTSPWANVAF